MRIFKKFILPFTAMLLIAVFFMPVTVYAADESEQTESMIPLSPKAFTPDGQATVIDWATEYDGKEFYTFKTPAGNVFYLIIDHARGMDNVYFLNAVTEQDLIALAEQAKNTNNSGGISVIPTTQPPTEDKTDENPDKPGTTPSKQNSNTGMIIFVLIGVAAVGGVAYYMKIVRPKKQANNDDEDDDIPENGGEDIEFENEPEETDEDSDNSDEDDE